MCEHCGAGPTCGVCGRDDGVRSHRQDRPDGSYRIDKRWPDGSTAIELYDVSGRLTAHIMPTD